MKIPTTISLEQAMQIVRRLRVALVGIAVLIPLVLAIILAGHVSDFYHAKKAGAWPTVTGIVLASRLNGGEGGCDFGIDFRYHYTVDGQDYIQNRYAFGSPPCGLIESHDISIKYPEGSQITIHYDPSAPRNSAVLVGTVLSGTQSALLWYPIFTLIFGWIAYLAVTRKLKATLIRLKTLGEPHVRYAITTLRKMVGF